ncbi:MAG: DMT family transporter [Thermoleophilia bacterium]|jgi:transporter family-2 protein|nr:DMT family transporter [Thermoleophilia bacterium]
MDRLLFALLATVGGGLIAAQAPINARLRLIMDSALGSAAVSFAIGTLVLAVAVALSGDAGSVGSLGAGPWWAYLGGACGAVFVTATLLSAPRVGVTATFVAVILGQVAVAALIDRFGWFGIQARPLSLERVAAIGLLLVSLALLLRR